MEWHWGNIGSALQGFAVVIVAIGALVKGPAVVRAWIAFRAARLAEASSPARLSHSQGSGTSALYPKGTDTRLKYRGSCGPRSRPEMVSSPLEHATTGPGWRLSVHDGASVVEGRCVMAAIASSRSATFRLDGAQDLISSIFGVTCR
jgi:hypothetical protein